METINSMASSAAKVIWGESDNNNTTTNNTAATTTGTTTTDNTTKMNTETQGQEPVSGKLGDTSKGEPFDAGNIETTQTPGTETSGLTGTNDKTSTTEASSGLTGTQSTAPTTETTGETTGSKGPTSELPSTTGDHGGFKAAQADIRDPETSATTDPKVEAQRKNVDDTGALDEGNNPAKADGPGPKPIEEVAREHGGDAAAVGGKKAEGDDDDPEGLHSKSDKKGTGEQYVKTSGLQADGGDFDATKPGAGKEADRLMEEKGIQTPAAAAASAKKTEPEDTSSGSPDSKKDKPSLKEKIKAKLHKN
ncbi:hypothetical protein N0V93_005280 [Gnomoniopsis smithogilvyi]|uniref:Glycine-rich cell wall structural protein 1 n=1 Tax=Gnomoniopsis smithogilvyi TaxID=1191159 RepID=A0A9W8YSL1_9PEZI|nr:hypothetical protein N0V93_005280 [Gnomoniopsis smithogilvyi]